jgi:hypothetical protein
MSSVLYILYQSVEILDIDTRISFYKSISKFWKVYRNMNDINANVMFRLCEIQTYQRKIDQSNFAFTKVLKKISSNNYFSLVLLYHN